MPTADKALDLAAALRNTKLTPYRGRDVVRTSIAITNAGDGLSNAMKIDPVEYDPEGRVYVVLECTVSKHQHVPIPDTGTMELIQTFKAGTATIVDADLVKEHIAQQEARIQAAKDAATGQANLEGAHGYLGEGVAPDSEFVEEDDATVYRRNHLAGNHEDEPVEGCPLCHPEPNDEAQA